MPVTAYLAKWTTYDGVEKEGMVIPLQQHLDVKAQLFDRIAWLETVLDCCGITDINYEKRTFKAPYKPENCHGAWGTKG